MVNLMLGTTGWEEVLESALSRLFCMILAATLIRSWLALTASSSLSLRASLWPITPLKWVGQVCPMLVNFASDFSCRIKRSLLASFISSGAKRWLTKMGIRNIKSCPARRSSPDAGDKLDDVIKTSTSWTHSSVKARSPKKRTISVIYRVQFRMTYCTIWKFKGFSVNYILREITIGE